MISILLAAHNGEKYIQKQIESLMSQTVSDFRIYVCDDKSTDETFSIVKEFAEKYPEKITAYQNDVNTGGAKHNFFKMMVAQKNDYVMLCDQDDVWKPDKVEISLSKMKGMEERYGAETPILVHTDLTVADENLVTISNSYQRMSRKNFDKNSLNYMLALGTVAGCTVMYNRALANLITSEPVFFVMHDWWVALVAAAFGKIGVINEPTVLYRQHSDNESGAKSVLSPKYITFVLRNFNKMKGLIFETYRQAESLLDMYCDKADDGRADGNKADNSMTGSDMTANDKADDRKTGYIKLSEEKVQMLKAYSHIPNLSVIKRIQTVIRYKTFMHGFARKCMQMIILVKRI